MRIGTAIALAALLSAATPALADDAPAAPPCLKDGAQVSDEYLGIARGILKTTRTEERMTLVLDATLPMMMDMMQKSSPDISSEAMEMFRTAAREEMLNKLPDLLTVEACVYARHFSIDELRQLEAFYESPLGQKMLGETPAIMKENMALGQAWGESAARTVIEHVVEKLRKNGTKI